MGLLYGYANSVFSPRKIERATYESVPFRFIAGNLHPDHDTLATFRRRFLSELKNLFVQVLLLAQEVGVLKLGTISLDGTKIHADASKRKAVSNKRLLELETPLRTEVEELFVLSEQLDQSERPDGLVVPEVSWPDTCPSHDQVSKGEIIQFRSEAKLIGYLREDDGLSICDIDLSGAYLSETERSLADLVRTGKP